MVGCQGSHAILLVKALVQIQTIQNQLPAIIKTPNKALECHTLHPLNNQRIIPTMLRHSLIQTLKATRPIPAYRTLTTSTLKMGEGDTGSMRSGGAAQGYARSSPIYTPPFAPLLSFHHPTPPPTPSPKLPQKDPAALKPPQRRLHQTRTSERGLLRPPAGAGEAAGAEGEDRGSSGAFEGVG